MTGTLGSTSIGLQLIPHLRCLACAMQCLPAHSACLLPRPCWHVGCAVWLVHVFFWANQQALCWVCRPLCVQVCVAALCIKQKDLLHAGYLAITLLFFRQRTSLITAPAAPVGAVAKGARLFLWLPAFNLLVMGLTLLYQVRLGVKV